MYNCAEWLRKLPAALADRWMGLKHLQENSLEILTKIERWNLVALAVKLRIPCQQQKQI